MRAVHIYIFFISLFCCITIGFGQERPPRNDSNTPPLSQQDSLPSRPKKSDTPQIKATDTLPPGEIYGLRVGVDISKPIRGAFDDAYDGIEVVADYRISQKFYIAAEYGHESLIRDETNINAQSVGNYAKLGIDYNIYDNWYGMQNSIFVGIRYGYSIFDQKLIDYTIYSSSNYFGTDQRTDLERYNDLDASWIDFIIGIKVELFKNLYCAANVSLRSLVSEISSSRFDNLHIPGFGRTNDFSSIGMGYGYSIGYLIPFTKKRKR